MIKNTPSPTTPERSENGVYLVASGDLRLSANRQCWPAQQEMEQALAKAVDRFGFRIHRAHPVNEREGHGFIASQREGIEVFRAIPPDAPLIVAEAVWQYSHHVLAGLTTHRGPILTVANWSGQWPGLVGMLNLNGSLTKAGVEYSTLWSEEFTDDYFTTRLENWLRDGRCSHDTSHTRRLKSGDLDRSAREIGERLAEQLVRDKAIMGVFDEGCMGMFNAIIPDHLLHRTGVFKERLSQSALYHETMQVSSNEANEVRAWMEQRGMRFHTGPKHEEHLTDDQIRLQCQMYIAAVRLADDFGCDLIGIQYQQGLKDLLPASDLVEGTLNNSDRPPVRSRDNSRVLFDGEPVVHFNEVDEGAGLDALLTYRVQKTLEQPVENTLHDIRWGDVDRSGTTDEYVWVFLISGAAPPAHFIGGWSGAEGLRQPAMYFPNGGSTLRGISKPGQIVWSRIYVADDQLWMDTGRASVVELPAKETQRRWNATTPQWPIMHAVLHGVSRNQLMAKHQSNHIQVVYSEDAQAADSTLQTKAAMATALGINVNLCGAVAVD
ncbi:MAG: fucose isomerase [Planctomycetes bacterium]|nr:fucose isomerase [Planctomycetota bacterium]